MILPSILAEGIFLSFILYELPLTKSPSCNLRIESSNSTIWSDLSLSEFLQSKIFLKILLVSESSNLVEEYLFSFDPEIMDSSSIIHLTFSSSPNEVGNGEFEMQMTTNIARMPSFNPLGNIFSKTLPALIPTG